MQRYDTFTRKLPTATAAPGAMVSVSTVGDPLDLQPIFSDNQDPPTAKANPFLADNNAELFFYAANGRYDVNIFNVHEPYTLSDVELFDPADAPNPVPGPFPGRGGVVSVWPSLLVASGPAKVYAPDGTPVDVTGTVTQGLQEAINYACNNGYDLHVYGGDETTFGAIVYNLSDTLTFPPMQGKSIKFEAVTLNWGSIGHKPGIRFDSCMMVRVDMRGAQLVHTGSDHAVAGILFKPEHPVPLDLLTVIIDSWFSFTTIGTDGIACLEFDTSLGSIPANFFEATELNSGTYGIKVDNPASTLQFTQNQIRVPHIHGQGNTSILVGFGPINAAARLGNNIWDVGISTQAGAVRGIDTYGSHDNWRVTSIDGTDLTGISLLVEEPCEGNVFYVGRIDGAIQDKALVKTNRLMVGNGSRAPFGATPGASPYVYPPANDATTLREQAVNVTGGTVSLIRYSPDNQVTWFTTGVTTGVFLLAPGTFLEITYTVAPTISASLLS